MMLRGMAGTHLALLQAGQNLRRHRLRISQDRRQRRPPLLRLDRQLLLLGCRAA